MAPDSFEASEPLDGPLEEPLEESDSTDDITAEMELPLPSTSRLGDEAEARLSAAAEDRLGQAGSAAPTPELVDTDGLFEAESSTAPGSEQEPPSERADQPDSDDGKGSEAPDSPGVGYETVSQPVQTTDSMAEESFEDLSLEIDSSSPLSEWDDEPGTTVLEPPVDTTSEADSSSEEVEQQPEASSESQISWDAWHAGVQSETQEPSEASSTETPDAEADPVSADSESLAEDDAFATRVLRTPLVPKPGDRAPDELLLDHPSEADTMSFPPLDPSRLSDAMDELATIETPFGQASSDSNSDSLDEDFEVEFDIDSADAPSDSGPGRSPGNDDATPSETGAERRGRVWACSDVRGGDESFARTRQCSHARDLHRQTGGRFTVADDRSFQAPGAGQPF